jgi:plastocyanin
MPKARLAALIAAIILALAACSGGGTSATLAPSAAAPAGGGSSVSIAGFAFAPTAITVAAGSTVTWTNSDSTGHTVTADDGTFKSAKLGGGATFSQTFAKAGTFTYHCSIHSSMTGTVTVH